MKTKRILALLLTLAVTIASFSLLGASVSAVDVQTQIKIPDGETTYTEDGVTYTVINSVEEMNATAAAGGKHYILNADLDYTGKDYVQIDLTNGSLNGNGHSITGVNLTLGDDVGADNNIAMFKCLNSTSDTVAVFNLTIGAPNDRVSVAATEKAGATDGTRRAGTLFAYLNCKEATIENVTVYSNVTTVADYRAGGIVGEVRFGSATEVPNLTMKNCVFDGDVTIAEGTAENKSVAAGGLLSYGYKATIKLENCATYGTVSHPNGYVGGLVGMPDRWPTITNCANYATVSGKYSGGLIGNAGDTATSDWSKLEMNNCFNAGKVIGTEGAAGLVYIAARRNDYGATLTNCANIGEVECDKDNVAGLIFKTWVDVTITNCGSFGTAGEFAITGTDTAVDAAAALAFMQENFKFAMFAIEGGKIVVKTVPAEARFIQYAKDTENGKMDIRLIGVINDADLGKYSNVGFKVNIFNANGDRLKETIESATTCVYQAVNANEGGTITSYTAADLGATYLYALELQNIPTTGTYTFEITAFATDLNDAEILDSVVTVTIVDGGMVSGRSYKIVYSESADEWAYRSAHYVKERIAEATGLDLKVVSDASEASDYEIIIGDTNRSGDLGFDAEAYDWDRYPIHIGIYGRKLLITADKNIDIYKDLSFAMDKWLENAKPGELGINDQICQKMMNAIETVSDDVMTILIQNLCTWGDAPNTPAERLERVVKEVTYYDADIFGVSEHAADDWQPYLPDALEPYGYAVLMGKKVSGSNEGDYNSIYYKADKFRVVEWDTFWYSNTPDIPGTKFDGAKDKQLATWAIFEVKDTGTKFMVLNTHLHAYADYGDIRTQQIEMLTNFIEPYMSQYPVYVMGDMNIERTHTQYGTLLEIFYDSREIAKENLSGTQGTYHNWLNTERDADFIFTGKGDNQEVLWYKVINERTLGDYTLGAGECISDHYGVCVRTRVS